MHAVDDQAAVALDFARDHAVLTVDAGVGAHHVHPSTPQHLSTSGISSTVIFMAIAALN